jgi:hypothetical protein
LPRLVDTASERRSNAAVLLEAARQVAPEELFTTAGQTLRRSALPPIPGSVAEDGQVSSTPPLRTKRDRAGTCSARTCDILSCQPNDLIEITVANKRVRKTADGTTPTPPSVRRTAIRRSDLS